MRILGLSPAAGFSGYETSFFEAVRQQGVDVRVKHVEAPWFKALCTLRAFSPSRNVWGTRRDRLYHTSIAAFRRKSSRARRILGRAGRNVELVYQIGTLWSGMGNRPGPPLVLQVEYTSMLSKRRGGEWQRTPGAEAEFWLREEKRLYESAAVVLTTTENARRSIVDDYGVAPERVVLVRVGVSPPYDVLGSDRLPRYDSDRVLFVGKGYVGKGLDTLLEAFAEVRRRRPKARLTVVGPTGVDVRGEGVEFLGRIADRSAVRDLYYEHALFAMPSRFETLGQTFLEAMACHLPCIGTTVDAMPEIIEHGKTGYLIEPGDSAALAARILEVLGRPELARAMGQAGFERVRTEYAWPVVGARIVRRMTDVLQAEGGGPGDSRA